MKNNLFKNLIIISVLVLLTFASCNNDFFEPAYNVQDSGMGKVIIHINSEARTALPDEFVIAEYRIDITESGSQSPFLTDTSETGYFHVEIDPGTFIITVTAYNDSQELLATGQTEISIQSGEIKNAQINLIRTYSFEGILHYLFNTDDDIHLLTGTFSVYSMLSGDLHTSFSIEEFEDSIILPSGYYRISYSAFILIDEKILQKTYTTIAHIYPGQTTPLVIDIDEKSGYQEMLTGTISISGTAQVGQTLTAVTTNLGGSGTISYQWIRSGNVNGTDSTYIVQIDDLGSTISLTVTRANNEGSITSDPTENVINPTLTGNVSISGTAQVEQTLTAVTTSLEGSGTISYQWMRGGNIIGTSSTYILQISDLGSTISLTVTRANNSGSVTSDPTDIVIGLPLDGTISISGTAQAGQTLTAVTTNLGGSGTISYQWMRDETNIVGTNSSTYIPQNTDIGSSITVTVIRANNIGSITSDPTDIVIIGHPLSGTVSINGIAEVGGTLSAVTANLGGSGTISYQWMRDETVIGTNSTYIIQAGDLGSTITLTVMRSVNYGSVTSDPTDQIILAALNGTVSISGFARIGLTLAADTTNLGGSGVIEYQWKKNETIIIGTNNNTYVLQNDDIGSIIIVTVTRSNNSGSVSSTPTAVVAGTGTSIMEMIWVPGGSFTMGSNDNFEFYDGSFNFSNSRPLHAVTLTGFNIGKYPVTQEQYQAIIGNNPSVFTSDSVAFGEVHIRRPVENVNWYDAIVFCNRLSILEGLTPAYRINGSTDPSAWGTVPKSDDATWNAVQIVSGSNGYRLPTEAQWEYAARGGNGSPGNFMYSGSNDLDATAWHTTNSGRRTREVGKKLPNGLGIYDMSGNVFEFCWDWYGSYTSIAKTNPTGSVSGSNRVVRGGSWYFTIYHTHTSLRASYIPFNSYGDVGFRVVRP